MKTKRQSVQTLSTGTDKSRRAFIKNSAAIVAVTATKPLLDILPINTPEQSSVSMMNGIQIGAVSFVDEGVEEVLDILQKRGEINTIFLTTFTYGRGLSGRQIPGQPFPDHGSQVSDEKTFYGGTYATPHPEFYRNTVLKETRAPEHGNLDIVGAVLPAARNRGMKLFCSVEDVWRDDVPGVTDCAEVDLRGTKRSTLCLFNPNVRAFWTGLVTDLCTSYDIDGILFFNERNGSLISALGASHSQSIASSRVTCFCEHHQRAAKEHGINFERARQGYEKLDQFVQASLKGQRPADGYYVEFQRILSKWPEIVAWDKLFDLGKHQVLAEVNAAVKAVRKNLQVGFHIEHVNSFNPYFRATRSYEDLAAKSDFLKVVAYNNCGGERYARFIRNINSTLFRDVPLEELMRFNNHLLNYGDEAPIDKLPTAGLSPDYVFRETQRALAGVKGKCQILPGIDINLPTDKNSRKASPEDSYAATLAGYKAGSQGVILSRKYSEMWLANLDAAGRAIRDAATLNKR
jgi:hypothetical protein